jgi:hypothetical protein
VPEREDDQQLSDQLKTKMKNNAEITYYANQNKLVD